MGCAGWLRDFGGFTQLRPSASCENLCFALGLLLQLLPFGFALVGLAARPRYQPDSNHC